MIHYDLEEDNLLETIDALGDIGKNRGYGSIIGVLSELFLKSDERFWNRVMTNYSKFFVGKEWKEIFQNLDVHDKEVITNALKQHILSNNESLSSDAKFYIDDFEIEN